MTSNKINEENNKIPLVFTQTVDLRFHSCYRSGINNKFSEIFSLASFFYVFYIAKKTPICTVPKTIYIYFAQQSRIQAMFSHYLFENENILL